MTDPLSIASSGIQAAEALTTVYASNIANLNTPGYDPLDAEIQPAPDGGLDVVDVVLITTPTVVQGSSDTSIDPAAQLANLKKAQTLYDANAAVIRAQEQMFGSLIDMLDTEQNGPPELDADNVL